jgi:hypothetical protein
VRYADQAQRLLPTDVDRLSPEEKVCVLCAWGGSDKKKGEEVVMEEVVMEEEEEKGTRCCCLCVAVVSVGGRPCRLLYTQTQQSHTIHTHTHTHIHKHIQERLPGHWQRFFGELREGGDEQGSMRWVGSYGVGLDLTVCMRVC